MEFCKLIKLDLTNFSPCICWLIVNFFLVPIVSAAPTVPPDNSLALGLTKVPSTAISPSLIFLPIQWFSNCFIFFCVWTETGAESLFNINGIPYTW